MKRILLSVLFGVALVAGALSTNSAQAQYGCQSHHHHHHGGAVYNSYRPNYGAYGGYGGYGGYGNVHYRPVYPVYAPPPVYYGGYNSGMGISGPRGNSIYFRW
jgi:hypothetical protein